MVFTEVESVVAARAVQHPCLYCVNPLYVIEITLESGSSQTLHFNFYLETHSPENLHFSEETFGLGEHPGPKSLEKDPKEPHLSDLSLFYLPSLISSILVEYSAR